MLRRRLPLYPLNRKRRPKPGLYSQGILIFFQIRSESHYENRNRWFWLMASVPAIYDNGRVFQSSFETRMGYHAPENTGGLLRSRCTALRARPSRPRRQPARAIELAYGIVTLMLDQDAAGEHGVQQILQLLAEMVPVRQARSSRIQGGQSKGRQPKSLKPDECEQIIVGLAGTRCGST